MTYRTRDNDGEEVTRKKKRTSNAIGRSPNREEYANLMQAGWSSVALERYALWRYGEEIKASAFRTYRRRHGWQVQTATFNGDRDLDPDVLLDLVHERAELIRLQKFRISVDVRLERNMNKLLSTTKGEIELLSRMLDQSKRDLQDLGLFPQAGVKIDIHGRVGGLEPSMDDGRNRFTPPAASLGELLGQMGPEEEMRMARMINDMLPGPGVNGNGHQVIEGGV